MSNNMFRVSSGLGKYQFTKSNKTPTPSNAMRSPSSKQSRQSGVYMKSDQEIIKQNNNELMMLKENYTKLRDQYQSEKKSYANKLMNLQNDLNSEQKRVKSLQTQLDELSHDHKIKAFYQTNGRSIAVIENIWELMQTYRDAVQNGIKISQTKAKPDIDEPSKNFSFNQSRHKGKYK